MLWKGKGEFLLAQSPQKSGLTALLGNPFALHMVNERLIKLQLQREPESAQKDAACPLPASGRTGLNKCGGTRGTKLSPNHRSHLCAVRRLAFTT